MPDKEKKPFIKENIVKKTRIGRGFRRVIIVLVSGILIGIIAAVTMVLSKPLAERFFGEEAETTAEVVIIPRDEVPEEITIPVTAESAAEQSESGDDSGTGTETETETLGTESERDTSETEEETTKPVEEIVQSAMEEYEYSIDDMTALWKNMSTLCDEIDGSIVSVKTISSGTDWFDNEISKAGEYSGIVIARTGYSVLLLTPEAAVKNKDDISVIWENGLETKARIKGADTVSGLAVISVDDTELDDTIRKSAKPVKLGNSYLVKRGDIMIALGSPKGFPHSTAYTWASYVSKNVSTIDGLTTLIYTTEKCDTEKGTWFINSKGELIGWSIGRAPIENPSSETVVSGLSEYKTILEKMTNGSDYPYLGIEVIDINRVVHETELPNGVYVTEVIAGSPAYQAGLQPGDIITKINDASVSYVNDYVSAVEKLAPSDQAIVSVKRNGRDEYVDIEYELTVGKR